MNQRKDQSELITHITQMVMGLIRDARQYPYSEIELRIAVADHQIRPQSVQGRVIVQRRLTSDQEGRPTG